MSETSSLTSIPARQWDIFCQVIDNYGDAGVCWRLATGLRERGQHVRLWMDDVSILEWLIPGGLKAACSCHGIEVKVWPDPAQDVASLQEVRWGDVLVEAFGCNIPESCVQALAQQRKDRPPVWINLEYLSAESYVERCHRLPSPLMSGPAAGWTRWFFYPGFTPATGGLLRSTEDMPQPQRRSAQDASHRRQADAPSAPCFSLFCYEPPALPALMRQWLAQWKHDPDHAPHWRVTAGRSTQAVQRCLEDFGAAWPQAAMEHWQFLAFMPQPDFDGMLRSCQLNLVRGEDSLVRALWAGQAFVWHIYPQEDHAHHAKLDAFLDWLQAPPSLRAFHHAWNGMADPATLPLLDAATLQEWTDCAVRAREKLWLQEDLVSQLLGFVQEKS